MHNSKKNRKSNEENSARGLSPKKIRRKYEELARKCEKTNPIVNQMDDYNEKRGGKYEEIR